MARESDSEAPLKGHPKMFPPTLNEGDSRTPWQRFEGHCLESDADFERSNRHRQADSTAQTEAGLTLAAPLPFLERFWTSYRRLPS
jgi:hypothetical protein